MAPGNFYTGERALPPAIEKNLREKYGFNKPWYVQYGKMINNIAHGDFGTSLKYEGQSVNRILLRHSSGFRNDRTAGLSAGTGCRHRVGNVCGRSSELALGLHVDDDGDARDFNSQLRTGSAARSSFFAGPVLVPSGTMGRLSQQKRRVAGDYAFGNLYGVHCPVDSIGNAGSSASGLRPDCASQRIIGTERGVSSCVSRRNSAGDFVQRTRRWRY